jgi:hypothetical protein
VELIWLFDFWLYLFNPRFRARAQERWAKARGLERGSMIFEGILAVLIGVVAPIALVAFLVFSR